ncbi:2-amino-3,7-dideoxy-D-threo-hept-6-ulosonate synthase [Halolamina salifodinae]|uniref:2-amino-3,7-dideoxy-D-threo-hept-6-ulosonate synthase n=1 Tax=Halolamina salifodinae TaxID=1202767 RepID=A0A8T4H0F9_9EURY|nr:2-amino-3,7-dideoxy-D-threo-hept-6-ulosonate synthase [Halolamina salifodinae]MBP1986828.1 fructose-bisphosphate aldolase/2-amino-3,7-dideoxy-D-threo-hept-6-ulosonate synthase [Halolamina salifodinae]
MQTGIAARLDRIGTDGKMLNVPMDHGITIGATDGLKDIESTIDQVTAAGADSVLTQKGLADRVHPNKNGAGYVIHLNASTTLGPDSNDKRLTGTVKEAVQRGADAVSLHLNVGSDYEPKQIEDLAGVVQSAAELGVPVLAMTYARGPGIDEENPDQLAHAARLGEELGADIIKTGYSGDPESFEQVVDATARPVIAAGGSPRPDREMLTQVRGVMDAGAVGVSMGRSVFQHEDPGAMTAAVSAIVHEDASLEEAVAELE